VGPNAGRRVWVSLRGRGESPFEIRSGQSLDFVGKVVENHPGLINEIGLESQEGSTELRQQGYYITVPRRNVELH
jgi:hypothetical protein